MKKSMRKLLDQIFTALAPPTWRAKDVGGNDTYGIPGNPFYGWRGVELRKE